MLTSRTSRRFAAALLVVAVMVVVNLAALVAVRSAESRVHAHTTEDLLTAQRVQFLAADMNGAQNLYLIDGGRSRAAFLASEHALARSIGSARGGDVSAADRTLLNEISDGYHRFALLDEQVWAAVERGALAQARRLAAGPETAIYHRMSTAAAALVASDERERSNAIDSLNRTEWIAIAVLLALALAALVLVGSAVIEWRGRRREIDETQVSHTALVEQMPLVLYHDSVDGSKPLYVSPGLTRILGYGEEEWYGRTACDWWMEKVHPDDVPRLVKAAGIRDGQITSPAFAIRLRVRHRSGEYRWMDVEETAVEERPGRSWRQGIIRDVHDEVIAERRYEDLVNRVPATVTIWNREAGTSLFVSPQFQELTGEPPSSWLGEGAVARWEERIHPEDRADPTRFRDIRDPLPSLYRWRRADGSYIWIREILTDQPGAEQNVIALMSDVTTEMESERELADERRRFQLLVEQLPVVTYISRVDGIMTYVSPQVEKMLGYTQAEYLAIGTAKDRAEQIVVPADAPRALAAMTRVRSGEVDEVDEPVRMVAKNGQVRYTQLIARPLLDETGKVAEVQGVIVDLTTLHEAERRSREVTAALVNAAEAEQARIAAELHDDTVQVMAALLMQLRLSMRDAPKLVRFEEILSEALDRTRRLMFEIRPQILEAEGVGPALTAIAREGPWAEGEGAFVDVQIPRQSTTTEAIAYRALRELVINARKHSRATRLGITGRQENDKLVFEVVDNGVGFEPVTALDRRRMALHVGLDATMERLRLAGGDLAIDAAPGRGARFTLTLPAEPRSASARDEAELVAPG
ncbi:MAG TPA: PAS domain-containing protein [Gaiellales bacterium]|nr:PAS domain-containing protein [Gaiellales bacterium]